MTTNTLYKIQKNIFNLNFGVKRQSSTERLQRVFALKAEIEDQSLARWKADF